MDMEVIRQTGKWVLASICIVLGLLYLNGAASSWWVSWGPPTEYPEAWSQRAIVKLGYAIALFSTAPMVFIAFKQNFNLKSSRYKYCWVFIVIIVLSFPSIRNFLLTDSCLDSGGSWQSTHFKCQYE